MLARAPLLAVLVYVTLDLSLPAMPGAFVFDPADSVESVQTSRGRGAPDAVALAPPMADAPTVCAVDPRPASASLDRARPRGERRVHPLPRASLSSDALTARSEDPH